MSKFHYLARGVIINDGKILVVKAVGANNTFLPGGHIETGEKAKDALVREIDEEIGKQAVINEFLGAVEHSWNEDGDSNFEINLIFNVDVSGLTTKEPPESKESHLRFMWLRPNELKEVNLKPAPLIELIKKIGNHSNSFWGSTL